MNKLNIDKDDSGMVNWVDVTKSDSLHTKAWMQIVYDYDPAEYQYNWDAEFVDSEGHNKDTKLDVSGVVEGDILKVSGVKDSGNGKRFLKVLSNRINTLTCVVMSESNTKDYFDEQDTTEQEKAQLIKDIRSATDTQIQEIKKVLNQ